MILDEDKSVKKTEAGQRKIKSRVRRGMGVWQGPAAGDSGLSSESHKRVSLVWAGVGQAQRGVPRGGAVAAGSRNSKLGHSGSRSVGCVRDKSEGLASIVSVMERY